MVNLPCAVVHNCNIHSAHHDIMLPCRIDGEDVNLPVSCKASLDLSRNSVIEKQLEISKVNEESVHLLIWLYLGNEAREERYQGKVVFLNGDGCCNGLALDMLILTKRLISQNNESL